MTKDIQNMLADHRERIWLRRCRTPEKVFIGGIVVGIFLGMFVSAIIVSNILN